MLGGCVLGGCVLGGCGLGGCGWVGAGWVGAGWVGAGDCSKVALLQSDWSRATLLQIADQLGRVASTGGLGREAAWMYAAHSSSRTARPSECIRAGWVGSTGTPAATKRAVRSCSRS